RELRGQQFVRLATVGVSRKPRLAYPGPGDARPSRGGARAQSRIQLVMTRSAHLLAVSIAVACFLLGGGALDRATSDEARPTTEPDARAAPEPQAGLHDELAARGKLTEPEAIRALEKWIQRKDALVDQFALYDAAARADAEGLTAMLAQLDFHPEPIAREARYVIRLRIAGPA